MTTKTKTPEVLRRNALSSLIRQGRATGAEVAEYEALDASIHAAHMAANPPRSIKGIWDLDVAASMWRRDARDIER